MKKTNKPIYTERYKKGTSFNPAGKLDVIQNIKDCETLYAIEAGKYEDGKEYLIVKIDRI